MAWMVGTLKFLADPAINSMQRPLHAALLQPWRERDCPGHTTDVQSPMGHAKSVWGLQACMIFLFFFAFSVSTGDAQGFLLALHSGIIPGCAWGTIQNAGYWIGVSQVQGKCATHCAITPALVAQYFQGIIPIQELYYACDLAAIQSLLTSPNTLILESTLVVLRV